MIYLFIVVVGIFALFFLWARGKEKRMLEYHELEEFLKDKEDPVPGNDQSTERDENSI